MYQTSIASHHHRTEDVKPLPPGVIPLPERLRAAGRFVSNGKDPEAAQRGKSDYNFEYTDATLFDGFHWRQRPAGKPFFAQIQIHEPHRPFVNQPVTERRHLDAPLPPVYLDHPLARRDWQAYLQSIERLDQKVGQILAELQADGLADNTIVLLFGDHGRPHIRDKQFLYDGGLRVPLIIRWPGHIPAGSVHDQLVSLIDLVPSCLAMLEVKPEGRIQGRSFWPLGQTPARDHIIAARDRCGDTDDRIRAVRTSRFKYLRNFKPDVPYTIQSSYKEMGYPMLPLMRHAHAKGELNSVQAAFFSTSRPVEELYDIANDPWETNNLASDPAHAQTLQTLRGKLESWITETADQGGIPETNPPLDQIIRQTRKATWDRPLKQRKLPNPPTDSQMIQWWQSEYQ
jgi:N-sulfoglucosamine sulfohydrolase